MDSYNAKRLALIKMANRDHFSNDIFLRKKELEAEKKLKKLRQQLLTKDPYCILGSLYDKMDLLKKSALYQCLDKMPKPAVHHIHLTAACDIDYIVHDLLYFDYVYYNQQTNIFKVNRKGVKEDGYIKVNDLRKYWHSSEDFDNHMKDIILLQHQTLQKKEHH